MPRRDEIDDDRPRARREDDYEEGDRPRKKRRAADDDPEPKRSRPWLIPAIIAGVLVVVMLAVGVGVILSGAGKGPAQPVTVSPPPSPPPLKKRDDVRAALMGKTRDEVIKLLGRPLKTTESGDYESWSYDASTLNEAVGKPDRRMRLRFEARSKTVDKVEFSGTRD